VGSLDLKIILPSRLESTAIFSLLPDHHETNTSLTVDFSNLQFINAPCVLYFKVMLQHWLTNFDIIEFYFGDSPSKATKFLISSGALDGVMANTTYHREPLSKTTLECYEFDTQERYDWMASKFLPWLNSCTQIPITDFDQIRMAISEVFNNILDHSGSSSAFTFSQWHPKDQKLYICIGDSGIGIRETLNRRFPEINEDVEAIIKASENGVTSQSVPGNRGVGLHNIIDVIVNHLNGSVSIVSKNGYAKFEDNDSITQHKLRHSCKGTLITMCVDTSKIVSGETEEDELW